MNFYKHHIGDYAQATSHLSFVEDAAYSRMIRKYYAEERPLPADLKAVQRLVGARTREEKLAVQAVLEEFFSLTEEGWRNKRCDAEVEKANAQADANRRVAEEREARKRARIEHESLAASSNESSTNRSPDTVGGREPSQTPDARHQTPDARQEKEARGSTAEPANLPDAAVPEPGQQPTAAGVICRALRAAGVANTNPGHPTLQVLLNAGATEAEFLGAAEKARDKRDPFAYVLRTVEGQRRDAAETAAGVHHGPMPTTPATDRKARQLATAGLMTGAVRAQPQQEFVDVDARVIPPRKLG